MAAQPEAEPHQLVVPDDPVGLAVERQRSDRRLVEDHRTPSGKHVGSRAMVFRDDPCFRQLTAIRKIKKCATLVRFPEHL